MAINVHAYLTFDGKCEEAFTFYKSVFGGEFAFLGRFKDMPDHKIAEADLNKVMHVYLPIGEGAALMGSDTTSDMPAVKVGNNISISVNTTCAAESKRIFDLLAEGGNVTMPFDKVFWDALFGMVTDKYGINWMVNCDEKDK